MAQIHDKRPVKNGVNAWYVDVTLHTGQRVQGIVTIDNAGCDFTTVEGSQIEATPDAAGANDWLDIVNASDTGGEIDVGWGD